MSRIDTTPRCYRCGEIVQKTSWITPHGYMCRPCMATAKDDEFVYGNYDYPLPDVLFEASTERSNKMIDNEFDELLALRKQVTRLEAQLADAQDTVGLLKRIFRTDTTMVQARLWRKLEASFIHADGLDWYDNDYRTELYIWRREGGEESIEIHEERAKGLETLIEKWYRYCVEEGLIVDTEVSE